LQVTEVFVKVRILFPSLEKFPVFVFRKGIPTFGASTTTEFVNLPKDPKIITAMTPIHIMQEMQNKVHFL
jgi:hypothetical protein